MPETTRSTGPNTPKRANIVHSAGEPLMHHASSMPSMVVVRACGWIRCSGPRPAPAPECSTSGATTTTSPWARIARASTWRPVDAMPSSLVTRILVIGSLRASWPCSSCSDRLCRTHVSEQWGGPYPRPRSLRHGGALVRQPRRHPVGTTIIDGDEKRVAIATGEWPEQPRVRHHPLGAPGTDDETAPFDRGEQVEGAGDDQPDG